MSIIGKTKTSGLTLFRLTVHDKAICLSKRKYENNLKKPYNLNQEILPFNRPGKQDVHATRDRTTLGAKVMKSLSLICGKSCPNPIIPQPAIY